MKTITLLFLAGFLAFSISLHAQNPKVHVLERITFTACGECPCLDSTIYTCIVPSLKNAVVFQYHTEMSALYSPDFDSLSNNINRDGSELRTNRDGRYYNYSFFKNIHQVCDSSVKYLQNDTVANVKIVLKSKSFDPVTRIVSVSADFTPYLADITGTFMVNAAITEDKIICEQSHQDTCGTPFGKGGRYKVPHNDVGRKLAFIPYGDILINGNWLKTQTLNRTFSLKLDSNLIASNCNIIVYVYKKADSICKSVMQQALKQSVAWPLGTETRYELRQGEIKIIPNPASNLASAHIKLPETGNASFSIYDLNGRLVKKIASARIENESYNIIMDLGAVSNGQYFFHVSVNGNTYTQKFTVVKR